MLATTRRHLLRALVAILAAGVAVLPLRANAEDKGPVVFAAASLKDALDAVNDAWQKQDVPADVFISADEDWMDYLATRKLIRADTRFDLLGNTLVLIAPKDSKLTTTVTPGFPLASLVGEGHLAMADTAAVPAGKYGKAALEKLDVWDGVKHKIAQAENVRAALALVSRGEAPLGIVYATDAKSDPNVKTIDTFPANTHPPIIYPAAATASSTGDVSGFLDFLKSRAADRIFEDKGFKVLVPVT